MIAISRRLLPLGSDDIVQVDVWGTRRRDLQDHPEGVQDSKDQSNLRRCRLAGLQVGQPASTNVCGSAEVSLSHAEPTALVPDK
jgi:hypothetical protein